jgi:hypothetical protein
VADPGETKVLRSLSQKQDAVLAACQQTASCDHANFTRGLLALYENRDTAATYFQRVIATAPKSRLAASSDLWLQLLRDSPTLTQPSWWEAVFTAPAVARDNVTLSVTTARLARDLLDSELTIQQLKGIEGSSTVSVESLQRELQERDKKIEALTGRRDPPAVQVLQREIVERDKKIDELNSKLEALKRIDQEMREKTKPGRPAAPKILLPPPVGDSKQ